MNMIISTFIYAVGIFILASIAWGSFGYFFFRLIGVKEKYWFFDCLLVYVIRMLWKFAIDAYLMKLDISIGNQEVLALINYDVKGLFMTDSLDFIICALEILLGYMLGKSILKKLKKRQII